MVAAAVRRRAGHGRWTVPSPEDGGASRGAREWSARAAGAERPAGRAAAAGADPAGAGGGAAYRRDRRVGPAAPAGARRRPSWPAWPPPACPAPIPTTGGGCAPLSDDRPLVDEGEPVRVTPSTMESALRCSLRWLLERHGGGAPAAAAQGVGNLVHAAAMLAEDANVDRERLVDYVAGRFDAIELAARWLAGPEQERAEAMVDKLLRWLADNPRRLLAIEHEFTVRLDDPVRPIELTGRVDRLEVDDRRPARRDRPEDRQVDRGHRLRAVRAPAARRLPGGGRGGRVRRARRRVAAARHWCSWARPQGRQGAGAGGVAATGEDPAGRTRWYAAPPTPWPPRPSRPWPTRAAGSARCGPAARSPARAARSWSRCSGAGRPVTQRPCSTRAAPHVVAASGRATRRSSWPGCCACRRRRAEQTAIIARAGGAAAGGGRRRLGQDRDDGRAGGVAGRQRATSSPERDPRPHVHPQGGRGAGAPRSVPGSASSCAGSARGRARRPGRRADRRHLPLVRRPGGHRARPAVRVRAGGPAAHRGVALADRRRCRAQLRRRHDRCGPSRRARSTDAVLALAGRAGRAPGHPRRARRLDRPVLRRGAGPTRARSTADVRQGCSPASGPGSQLLPLVRAYDGAQGATSRRWTSATRWPAPRWWPATIPRSARSSGTASGWCCSTSTRTPATRRWCCCTSLFGGGHPVTAVGDPCQSIYGWRGAQRRHAGPVPARVRPPGRRARRRADADHELAQPAARSSAWPTRCPGRCARPAHGSPSWPPARRGVAARRGGATVHCALLPTYADEAEWIADRCSPRGGWRPDAGRAARRHPGRAAADQRGAGAAAQPDPGDRGGAARARGCRSRWSASAACSTPPRYATSCARCGCWPTRPTGRRCCGCSPGPLADRPARPGRPAPPVAGDRGARAVRPAARRRPTEPEIVPTGSTRRRWSRRWPTWGRPQAVLGGGLRAAARRTARSWPLCGTASTSRCPT